MTKEEQIKQMMEQGLSDTSIAKAVHVSRSNLAVMRKSFGLPCFKKFFRCDYSTLESIVADVNSGKSTLTEEAIKHNTNRHSLTRCIRQHGLELNEYRPQHPKFADEYELTAIQKQMLVGDMLGDGALVSTSDNKAYYQCSHSCRQSEFVEWKYDVLAPLSSRRFSTNDGRYTGMGTYTCNALGEYRRIFYPEGKGYKVIPISCIENLSPLGLAVWYMGDGSLNRNTGVVTIGRQINNVYEVNEALNGVFGCNSIVKEYNRCYQIRFKDYIRFFGIISPFLLESFGYKISPAYLASIDNQQPSLERNLLEGSSTRESLNRENGMAITPADNAKSTLFALNGTSDILVK